MAVVEPQAYERMLRDGAYLREATEADVRAFALITCEEDLVECEVAYGVPRDRLADDNLKEFETTLGFYILELGGEPCCLVGINVVNHGELTVWMQSSIHLARHKVSYVRWMRDALVSAIVLSGAVDARKVWTSCWQKHRVCRTIERLLEARIVDVEGEVNIYRLDGIEKDLKEYRDGRVGD